MNKKDPAVLWYFNDWGGGTVGMTRHQKGAYMDLLHAQFNLGDLSLVQIKNVLGSDFGAHWSTIKEKFTFDLVTDTYYNERLKQEREKRSNFTDSRRSNRLSKSLVSTTEGHMEDVNENRNKDTELPNWLNVKAWAAWEQHRKEKNKALTPTSKRLQLKLLEENKETHTQIIKNSITNGWTGLFPLKENGFRKPNKYVEPNLDKEMNQRRNELLKQFNANK